jgi:hypothetical protein
MVSGHKSPPRFAKERNDRNRRAFPRWAARFELRFGTGTNLVTAEVIEIGEGGLSFYSDEPIAIESEVNIEYRLDAGDGDYPRKGNDWVRLKAVVRHAQGGKIGVEFLNLRRSNRLEILDFIAAPK